MNEPQNLHSTQPTALTTSPGSLIRAQRERLGLLISDLAVVLKVPQVKLEALEADRFDLLSDAVFLRALASSVCRTLKMDASDVLAGLPKPQLVHIKTDQAGLNTPFQRGNVAWFDTFRSYLRQPLILGVLLVLAVALLMVMFPLSPPNTEVASAAIAPTSSALRPVPPVADSSNPVTPAVTPVSAPIPDSSAADAAPLETEVLSLRALGSAWVEVIDAKANVLIRRHMGRGETVLLQGVLPLSVVLGRVDLMVVKVRGKELDVRDGSSNKVVRFEVK